MQSAQRLLALSVRWKARMRSTKSCEGKSNHAMRMRLGSLPPILAWKAGMSESREVIGNPSKKPILSGLDTCKAGLRIYEGLPTVKVDYGQGHQRASDLPGTGT